MKYVELSIEKLKEISVEAASKIADDNIDLIIYVAKAGYLIAKYMSEVINCKILGITAQRKGNSIKNIFGPLLSKFPRFVRNFLISLELKSNVHNKESKRNVEFHKSIENIDIRNIKSILIVDDSVDTGHSMNQVYDKVSEMFPNANIHTYSLNVWEKSKSVFNTEYYSYMDTVIKAPMSKDSKEYKTFYNIYISESENEYV